MRAKQSHGRLKLPLAWLAIPMGIAMIGWVGGWASAMRWNRHVAESRFSDRLEGVTAQSRMLADEVTVEIESLRAQASIFGKLRSAQAAVQWTLGSAPLWAELQYAGGRLTRVLQASANAKLAQNPQAASLTQEALVEAVSALPSRAATSAASFLGEARVALLKPSMVHSNDWLALGFPQNGIDRMVWVVVDPFIAFPAFRKFAARSDSGLLRGYLLAEDGAVLAHSQETYAGSNFSATPLFKEAVAPLFAGSRRSGSGQFRAIDRSPVLASYQRVENLPLALVVERVALPLATDGFSSWVQNWLGWEGALSEILVESVANPQVRSAGIESFLWLALLLAGVFAAASGRKLWLRGGERGEHLNGQPDALPELMSVEDFSSANSLTGRARTGATPEAQGRVAAVPAPLPNSVSNLATNSFGDAIPVIQVAEGSGVFKLLSGPSQATFSEQDFSQGLPTQNTAGFARPGDVDHEKRQLHQSMDDLKQRLLNAEQFVRSAREESKVLNQFEEEARRLRDPRLVAHQLVHAASQLCGGPTLFFTYHERTKMAVLQADAGFANGDSPASWAFPVDPQLLSDVHDQDARAQVATLTDYRPLSQLVLARTGVAHFEAWAVTGYGHLGRQAGRTRLLGVLVVLESGVESYTRQDSLARMMRSTGLIYENALLSLP